MNAEISENEIIQQISLISPTSWSNIPEPVISAFTLMIKLFSQDHEKINNLIEKVDDLNSTSASKAFFLANQAKKLDESFLTTENKLKNSLADSELYMQNRLKKNEKLISDIVEEMNKQTKELNSKLNNIARLNSKNDEMMVKFIETSKEELKNEFTEHFEAEIQILKVETQDMSNFLDRFEKAMKNSLVLVESSMDEHISKQVIELKQEMKTLQNNSDLGNEITANLITQRNEELKESFRNLDQKIKWAMRDIHSEKDKIIGEVMTREREMTEKLDDIVKRALFKVDMIDEIILNEENMRNKLIIDSQLLKQEITDFCAFTRTDLFDINTKTLIQIKEDLLHTLDEELIVIRKKLDWLPMDFSEIKDFNSVEARIYVLETRLRIEETNRMLERENIIHDLEKLKSNSKTQTRTTANRPKCSTPMASRPKTRTNQTVRKTISPGGMCTVEMWGSLKTPKSPLSSFTRSFKSQKDERPFDFTKDLSGILPDCYSVSRPKSPNEIDKNTILGRYNSQARQYSIVTASFPDNKSQQMKNISVETNEDCY